MTTDDPNAFVQEALRATEFVMHPDRTEGATVVDSHHLKTLWEAASMEQAVYNRMVEAHEQSMLLKAEATRLNRRTRRLMRTCYVTIGIAIFLIGFHLVQIILDVVS